MQITDSAGSPRPLQELLEEAARGGSWLNLAGPAPTSHPELASLIERLVAMGRQVRLVLGTNDAFTSGRLRALSALGVRNFELDLRGWGSASTTLAGPVRSLQRAELDFSLLLYWAPGLDVGAVKQGLALAIATGRTLVLRATPWAAVSGTQAARIDRWLQLAARRSVNLRLDGVFHLAQPRREAPPRAPHALDDAALRAGFIPPSLGRPTGDIADELALHLDACGADTSRLSLPPTQRCSRALRTEPSGGAVHLLAPPLHDRIFSSSTLPALVDLFKARGREVVVHRPSLTLPTVGVLRRLWDRKRPEEVAEEEFKRRRNPGWVRALDFSGADLIIAPGFLHGSGLIGHPTLPATARVLIADFHALEGVQAFASAARRQSGSGRDWWPGEQWVVHSCFPAHASLYRNAGVPLRAVHWRPYPVHTPDMAADIENDAAYVGGNHRRDQYSLAAAYRRVGADIPVPILYSGDVPVRSIEPLKYHPAVPAAEFTRLLTRSPFAVVSLNPSPRHPAGITVFSIALAAGRPVIATRSPSTTSHLRDGVDSVLLPVGDVDALAAAIGRLHTDVAFYRALAEGARASAERLSAATWCQEILTPSLGFRRFGW